MTLKTAQPYDAVLILSFGGPEGMCEVIPFLENVLRGRNVPHERLLEVAHHYELFGGVSPINGQNRALIDALREEFDQHGVDLPIYWGNRNWHPLLADTLRQMAADGVQNALAFLTSAYSSYSGCRQYREDIQRAQDEVGVDAPQVSVLRKFYNHPGFIEPNVENIRAALDQIPVDRQPAAHLVFTAHSIPESMARTCTYQAQLMETCRLIADRIGYKNWQMVYQSRSGAPGQPWLGPDVNEYLRTLHAQNVTDMVIAPVGFISDHMEVLYDLDVEARQTAAELGLNLVRAATVGVHPAFISMIRELVLERMDGNIQKRFWGMLGPSHDICAVDCCPVGQGRPVVLPASTHT
ncbi:MAG: ferrochelatase [Chloroflexota bacterium]